MAKIKKTMRITLTEDFLVPTDDGNIIFEPGDELEIEYEEPALLDEPVDDDDALFIGEVSEIPADDADGDALVDDSAADPLSFAGNEGFDENPEEDEVYIEDPFVPSV